eukprot:m.569942 g.569942  ORF g.569942 m.569942 type:complete len:1209 (-) comp57844_c0_seq6:172-3798(-)
MSPLRLVVKIGLGLLLFVSLVTTKLSMFHLANGARSDASAYAALVVIVAVPYALTLYRSALNHLLLAAHNRLSLSYKEMLGLFVRSCLEVLGVSLLVFRVFIAESSIIALSLMTSAVFCPTLTQLYVSFKRQSRKPRERQVPLSDRGVSERTPLTTRRNTKRGPCGCGTSHIHIPKGRPLCEDSFNRKALYVGLFLNIACLVLIAVHSYAIIAEAIVGVLLISLTWYDVYVHRQSPMYFEKRDLASTFQSFVSLLVVFACSAVMIDFVPGEVAYTSGYWSAFVDLFSSWNTYSEAMLVNCVTAYFSYFLALTAVRLRMQFWGFAMPIVTAPVVLALIVSLKCWVSESFDFVPSFDGSCSEDGASRLLYLWELAAFSCSYIAFVVSTLHIFKRSISKPLAKEYDVFERPGYSGVFTESIALNRKVTTPTYDRYRGESSTTYVCITLWRETETEMRQLCTSLLSLVDGWDYAARRKLKFIVTFDQPFDKDKVTKRLKLNRFAEQLRSVITSVFKNSSIEQGESELFGWCWKAQLGQSVGAHSCEMTVLFKDPDRIRRGKRWSMLTYMDYITDTLPSTEATNWTYLLTLDGDVGFDFEAVQQLTNALDVDQSLGGVCGRIKPIGDPSTINPLVWFQKFEYEIGHMLMKTSENIFGSVLCLPGCFSMLRLCCVARERKTYATLAKTGFESLQFDQGEDRKLSMLLVGGGSTLGYVPSAVAVTFCPEDFAEFFNQRRRWIASTVANLISLLAEAGNITANSNSVGWPFVAFQAIVLLSSLISPAVVILLVISGLSQGLDFSSQGFQYFFVAVQVVYVWILISESFKSSTKMKVTSILSLIYTILMGAILVGLLRQMVLEPQSASTIFFLTLAAMMLIASLLTGEILILAKYGLAYFLCVPVAYLVLPLYSFANLIDTSWGTRVGSTKTEENAQQGPRMMWWCQQGTTNGISTIMCGCGDPPPAPSTAIAPVVQPTDPAVGQPLAPLVSQHVQPQPAPPVEAPITTQPLAELVTHSDTRASSLIPPQPSRTPLSALSSCSDEEAENLHATMFPELSPDREPSDVECAPLIFIDPSHWPNHEVLFNPTEDKTLTQEKSESLLTLRWEILALLAVCNFSWIFLQFAVMKSDTLNIKDTNTNIFGLLFLGIFAIVSIAQFLACVVSSWHMFLQHLCSESKKVDNFDEPTDDSESDSDEDDAVDDSSRREAALPQTRV